jgi:tape measure domain-containing protein
MAIERSIRINVEAGRAKRDLDQLSNSFRKTDLAASATSSAVRTLTVALAGIASVNTARQLLRTADSYTNLQNKITTVIEGTQSLADTTDRLFKISNRALTPIDATVSLYQKLTLGTKSLNASQEDLFRVVETVAKAGAIANDGLGSLSSSLIQLGQAFGGDFKAAAQEFNSILEQTPAIAKAIADGLGVEVSELKRLGEQGVLSSKLVFNALLQISDSVDNNFSKAVVSVSASIGILQNSIIQYVGEVDKANGITSSISQTIRDFAVNFEDIADTVGSVAIPVLETLAVVIGARLVGATGAYTVSLVAAIASQGVEGIL